MTYVQHSLIQSQINKQTTFIQRFIQIEKTKKIQKVYSALSIQSSEDKKTNDP